MMYSTLFAVVSIVGLLTIDCLADKLCYQKEILEFGKTGQIRCSFQVEYFGVYWYDTQDLTQQPITYTEAGEIGGYGYESEEFDLTTDGSLIINNVTVKHEKVFTVVILETPESPNLKHETIDVKVFARPRVPYPVIQECEERQFCYKKLDSYDELTCTVEDARPPVHLKWLLMTVQQEVDVTSRREYSYHRGLNTTTVTMGIQIEATSLHLLACEADHNTMVLDTLASVIIAEFPQLPTNVGKVDNLSTTTGSKVTLVCNGFDDMLFFVWKMMSNGIQDDVIAYGYNKAGLMYSKQYYNVNSEGLLVITGFKETLEGLYVCYTSDGTREQVTSYNLTFVSPPLIFLSTVKTATEAIHEQPEQRKNSTAVIVFLILAVIVAVVVVVITLVFPRVRRRCGDKKETGELSEQQRLNKYSVEQYHDEDAEASIQTSKERHENITDEEDKSKDALDEVKDVSVPTSDAEEDNTRDEMLENKPKDEIDHDDDESTSSTRKEEDKPTDSQNQPEDENSNHKRVVQVGMVTKCQEEYQKNDDNVTEARKDDNPIDDEHQEDENKLLVTPLQEENTTLEEETSNKLSIDNLSYTESELQGIKIRDYMAGDYLIDREKKIILVCGTRGPSKTRLINDLINFFVGTKQDNDIQYELQGESKGDCVSKDNSVVNRITIYTNPRQNGFDLTIMDLHESDKSNENASLHYTCISKQICTFLHCDNRNQLSYVNAIIFVEHHQLAKPGCYLFTRLFGKNLREYMFIYETSAVLNTQHKPLHRGYRSRNYFLLHLTANKKGSVSQKTEYIMWDKQKCSFDQFYKHLEDKQTSFNESIEVIRERVEIEERLGDIKKSLQKYLQKRKSWRNLQRSNQNIKVDLEKGVAAMTCRKCKTTCHSHCNSKSVRDCKSMKYLPEWRGCGACSGQCYPSDHEISPFRYKFWNERAKERKDIRHRETEMKSAERDVLKDTKIINKSLHMSSKKALTPTVLSVRDYGGNITINEALGNNGNFDKLLTLMESYG